MNKILQTPILLVVAPYKVQRQLYSEVLSIHHHFLNIPYQNNQTEFERHYGEIEVNGKYYTYVKRKIENGFLVLKCIPNNSKEKIKAAGNDFFKMANGLAQDQQGKKQNSNFAKNFWSEYDGRETNFTIDIFSDLINRHFLDNASSLSNTCLSTPSQPPEALVLPLS